MAASGEQNTLGQVGQEATCPLCLDFFKQPMGLSCGHNFCRDCLAQLGAEFSCPQCRAKVKAGSACPNRPLANIVDLVKRVLEGGQEESDRQLLCQEHGQPLQIFCSREKSLLCTGCLRGHKGHPLLSLPEAAQEFKDLLDGLLESLRKEKQKLLEQGQAGEQSQQECQEKFATQKQEVGLALESLQELLRERQSGWLAWLAEQEKKMEAEWGVALVQLYVEATCLQQLIDQTERKCHQPDGKFLQDIQDTVDRCWSYLEGRGENVFPRLQGRLRTLLEKNTSVRQVVDKHKASLQTALTREHLERLLATAPAPEKPRSQVLVRLDRSTAHPQLRCRSLTWASSYQKCPDVPERFDEELCVLGCEGFTRGCHWWEVSVLEAEKADDDNEPGIARWAVGVAKASVRRKGSFRLTPKVGIWALGKNVKGEIVAFSNPQRPVRFRSPLRRLRVILDYEVEEMEILNAEGEDSLYTFQMGPLDGETLRPFFYLGQEGVSLQCAEYPLGNYWERVLDFQRFMQ